MTVCSEASEGAKQGGLMTQGPEEISHRTVIGTGHGASTGCFLEEFIVVVSFHVQGLLGILQRINREWP